MGATKGQPRAKDWLTSEVKTLCDEWAAGVATEELAEKYGRTVRAIEVMARDCRARRPKGFNRPTAWQRIEKSFEAAEMQTVDHMILTTGMWKSTILKAIQSHRHLLHVAKWVDSARSDEKGKLKAVWALGAGRDAPKHKEAKAVSKRVNPFATAAGLIQAPAAANGRVYHHLRDDHDMGEAA
jgi:hypothetical protein